VKRIFEEYIGKTNQDLVVKKEKAGDALVFHCQGALSALNATSSNELVKAVGAAREKKIILDLSGVVHMDSAGVGLVAAAFKQASAAGATLVLVAQTPIRDALETAGLHKFLLISDDLATALTGS
jgi:anti-anti-sigma factor